MVCCKVRNGDTDSKNNNRSLYLYVADEIHDELRHANKTRTHGYAYMYRDDTSNMSIYYNTLNPTDPTAIPLVPFKVAFIAEPPQAPTAFVSYQVVE